MVGHCSPVRMSPATPISPQHRESAPASPRWAWRRAKLQSRLCLATGASKLRTYELLATHASQKASSYAQARWIKPNYWMGLIGAGPHLADARQVGRSTRTRHPRSEARPWRHPALAADFPAHAGRTPGGAAVTPRRGLRVPGLPSLVPALAPGWDGVPRPAAVAQRPEEFFAPGRTRSITLRKPHHETRPGH